MVPVNFYGNETDFGSLSLTNAGESTRACCLYINKQLEGDLPNRVFWDRGWLGPQIMD